MNKQIFNKTNAIEEFNKLILEKKYYYLTLIYYSHILYEFFYIIPYEYKNLSNDVQIIMKYDGRADIREQKINEILNDNI